MRNLDICRYIYFPFNRTIEELKLLEENRFIVNLHTFNRTIEELKYKFMSIADKENVSFNRTIEELKYIQVCEYFVD